MCSSAQKLKVFISYSRKDGDFAEDLLVALEACGFDAYLDQFDIAPGENWEDRLAGLIQTADTVVYVISPDSIASKRCVWEIEQARGRGKRLIPVVVREVPEPAVPDSLRSLNYIFFSGPKRSFGKSLAALSRALGEDINWIREHTRLSEIAARWNANGRGEVYLIRGEEINAAKAWLARQPGSGPEPTLQQREFVLASESAEANRLAEVRTREALAKDTEIRRIQAEQEAERLRHESARRRTLLVAACIAVVLIVVAVGLWTWFRERQAELKIAQRDQQIAQREQQIAELTKNQLLARLEAPTDPDVSAPAAEVRAIRDTPAAAIPPAVSGRLSAASLKMLAEWEVGGEEAYRSRFSHPTVTGTNGGIAIGVGYDLGFVDEPQFRRAWSRYLPPSEFERLAKAVGVKGPAAHELVESLADISVPWNTAMEQFRAATLPPIVLQIEKAMPNASELTPDSFGALVSLAYNRGPACFTRNSASCAEMYRIRELVAEKDFAAVPEQIRKMKRLFPSMRGMQARRDAEALMFERGLAAPS